MVAEIGPLLRTLMRDRVGAVLIALQIAFTVAVVVNAWAIIAERLERMDRPSGVVEDELFHIPVSGYTPNFNAKASVDADLALLRQMPGVVAAMTVNTVPMSQSGWAMGLSTAADAEAVPRSAAVYMVDSHGVDTFGLELLAGRDFAPEDVRERSAGLTDWPPTTILSAAMAKALWPDAAPEEVVGRTVYIGDDEPMTVIGVVARLQSPWPTATNVEDTMLVPDKTISSGVRYLIRTEPGRVEEMMPVVEEALAQANRARIVGSPESMAETRAFGYWLDSGLSAVLVVVMAALLLITAFGIVGLASFSVRRRTRQIGTRRALGARKVDILRYFLLENFAITTLGVVLGTMLAIAANVLLVQSMGLPRIDAAVVLLGMVALWLLGQIAVFGPARRACAVPPAVATRTV